MTRVQLFLPAEMEGHQIAVEHTKEQLAKRFGGFTVVEAEGGWHNGEGIVTEPVTVVEAFGDVSHENAVIFMDGVAEYVAGVNLYDESAIMFSVDNSQYFVETGDGELTNVA